MGKKASKLQRNQLEVLIAETYFSEKEIRQWHKGFLKDCPNGMLNEEGFSRIYAQFFPHGDPARFASLVFRVFDANDDGCIEFDEFIRALSVTSRGSMDEKLKWAFRLYDVDSDGYITREEMYSIVEAICKMVGQPVDRPGSIARVDKIFQMMDKNHDDRLTLEEFTNGSKCDPRIVKALDGNNGSGSRLKNVAQPGIDCYRRYQSHVPTEVTKSSCSGGSSGSQKESEQTSPQENSQ